MHHAVFPARQCSRAFKTVGGICQDGDFLPAHQRQNFDTDFNRHRGGGNQGEEETGFEHREIHQFLLDKANRLNKSYREGTVSPSIFFSFIVDDVLRNHLQKEDRKFYPYVKMNHQQ